MKIESTPLRHYAASSARQALTTGLRGALIAAMVAASPPALAAGYPLYRTPPSAEELADRLFPTRYRNAAQAGSGATTEPDLFAMLIRFDFDSDSVRADSAAILDSVGEMLTLEQVDGRAIIIEGHTDAVGAERYNESLSQRRATAVQRYLVERFGISPNRLVTVGKGESVPYSAAAPTDPRNRRVVFRPLRKLVLK